MRHKAIRHSFTLNGNIGIFCLDGELRSYHKNDLSLILMKALYSVDRAVVNLKNVTMIDSVCVNLLREAYCTSITLRNPIILTEVPHEYIPMVYDCARKSHAYVPPHHLNYKKIAANPGYSLEK